MDKPYADLIVVGYADHIPPSMRPCEVPPVFRVKDDQNTYIVPSYRLTPEGVSRGWEVSRWEIKDMDRRERVTLFPGMELQAEGRCLWLLSDGSLEYRDAIVPRTPAATPR